MQDAPILNEKTLHALGQEVGSEAMPLLMRSLYDEIIKSVSLI